MCFWLIEIELAVYDLDRKGKEPSPLEAMEAARLLALNVFLVGCTQ